MWIELGGRLVNVNNVMYVSNQNGKACLHFVGGETLVINLEYRACSSRLSELLGGV